jgi:hypothetical protein
MIPRNLYLIHKMSPLVTIQSHMSRVHSTPSFLRYILILSTYLRLSHHIGVSVSGFSTKTLLDLIILILLVDYYKSRSSSLCSFLYPHVISSLLDLNIVPNTVFSNTLCSSSNIRDPGKVIIILLSAEAAKQDGRHFRWLQDAHYWTVFLSTSAQDKD